MQQNVKQSQIIVTSHARKKNSVRGDGHTKHKNVFFIYISTAIISVECDLILKLLLHHRWQFTSLASSWLIKNDSSHCSWCRSIESFPLIELRHALILLWSVAFRLSGNCNCSAKWCKRCYTFTRSRFFSFHFSRTRAEIESTIKSTFMSLSVAFGFYFHLGPSKNVQNYVIVRKWKFWLFLYCFLNENEEST